MDNNNLELVATIVDRIKNAPEQQITFAEYMELVLYHPQHGYYASNADSPGETLRERIGERGDFLTSPHLADDFGEMLAIQLEQIWQILGAPALFSIVEMGAGQGLLAAQVLAYSQKEYPDFFRSIDYIIIETAPAMIAAQQGRLLDLPVRWCNWDDLPDRSIVGCFLSNELIDALPVHQVIVTNNKLQEIYVTVGDRDRVFNESIDELSTDKLTEYWQLNRINLLSDRYSDNYRTEVNLSALSWLERVSNKLQRGYIISIDYGYSADRYYNPMRDRGTLQCYYQHAHHNDPYINIGNQDLTAHVDFTALQNQGELLGLQTVGFTQQGMFLMALGLGERIAAISSSSGDIQSLLRRRQNLHQLIDPIGLGKFGILIQSQGLTSAEREIVLIGLSMSL
ncbi:class I SAM-dependent methyltransferase [Chamaesiphon sp. VAR_69_metabat_338]|uniref:class I SAM-dependent methyltransferase n=1 Tax=Chamaesiphon sp. VAR_69_metabat_338 TaxID=2964704 RepID=UPI00286E376A|nr:class I SAM-dependent methyltransferase [Chamaesiphon sp. VAR_69_metabat_338]